MSRTDKTRPWQVQANEDLVAVHDHADGECNLPTREDWIASPSVRRWSRHDCTWQPRNWGAFKGFSRSKGEGEWRKEVKNRKYKDWKDSYDD